MDVDQFYNFYHLLKEIIPVMSLLAQREVIQDGTSLTSNSETECCVCLF